MSQVATEEQTKTYTIDPAHSTVRFWVRHMMIAKVHGEISDVTGSVSVNSVDPGQSTVDVVLNAGSITTNNEQRDAHLKSGDFLSVEEFPTITFKSTKVTQTGPTEYVVDGDLTIRGVTKPVQLEAEITPEVASPFGGFKVGVSATGVVDREDFGVVYNMALETGGVLVGKEIHLQIDLELDRPA